jgi:ribonuclease HII
VASDARSGGKSTRHRWKPIERDLRVERGPHIAGIDEVGRGPLAGPVVACAVVMPHDQRAIRGVDDSKKLNGVERERLALRIFETAVSVGVGAASVREIDRVNIYHATVIAMRRSLRRLSVVPHHVLIDGKPIRSLETPHTAIVGGDACCYTIACASIIAKVTRDRLMRALASRYPNYRWENNVGYSTLAHLEGMVAHGITPHHRRSFVPVRQLSFDFNGGGAVLDIAALQALATIDESAIDDGALDGMLDSGSPTLELPPVS